MSDLALALRQVRWTNRAFWRNPAAAFFTFVFPLMFMVIFNLLFDAPYEGFGREVRTSTFYTPAIIAFSVITACYTNLAMSVVFLREEGVLKRVRGAPLPAWAYLSARITHSVLVAALLVVIVGAFGALAYGVELPFGSTLPAFLVTLVVGAASFSALGLAVSGATPNADAAPAVINASILPLLFLSDIFIPLDRAPGWVGTVAGIFPIKHFSAALLAAFNPFETGSGFRGGDLAVIAAWGVAGALIAVRTFRWEPSR